MNMFPRLLFVLLSIVGLALYGYTGITSPEKLSNDMLFGHWAAVFALLALLTAALQTKGDVAVPLVFVGIFLVILGFGMYKQTGGVAYSILTWLGLMLCGTAIAVKVMDHIPSRTNCKICTGVRATGVHIGIPHSCSEHQHD